MRTRLRYSKVSKDQLLQPRVCTAWILTWRKCWWYHYAIILRFPLKSNSKDKIWKVRSLEVLTESNTMMIKWCHLDFHPNNPRKSCLKPQKSSQKASKNLQTGPSFNTVQGPVQPKNWASPNHHSWSSKEIVPGKARPAGPVQAQATHFRVLIKTTATIWVSISLGVPLLARQCLQGGVPI